MNAIHRLIDWTVVEKRLQARALSVTEPTSSEHRMMSKAVK